MQSIANLVHEFREDITYRIFCGNTDLNNTSLDNIETGKWVDYNSCTQVWYAHNNDRSSTLLKLVEQTRPDVIFIIGLFSWQFNIVPFLFCKTKRKIISVRGMLHPGALSQKAFKKKIFISLLKIMGITRKTFFHATDPLEKEIIMKVLGKEARVFTAGNFPHRISPGNKTIKQKGQLKLLSIALISPMKNHLLVFEALAGCTSNIEYHICGPVKDMEYWQLCLQQQKKIPANIKVMYHGDIQPAQVPQYLEQADVFILPSKSENFGHAIYEALSAGVPVITSRFTPWNGLEKSNAGLNVENNQSEIKTAIDRFVEMDEASFKQWQKNATAFAANSLDFANIRNQYTAMFGNGTL